MVHCSALLQCWCVTFLRCTMDYMMDDSYYSTLIRTYMDNYHKMRVSNDTARSDPRTCVHLEQWAWPAGFGYLSDVYTHAAGIISL